MQPESSETFTCSRCGGVKPRERFPYRPGGGRNGSRCNDCQTELRRIERANRPKKAPPLRDRDLMEKRCRACGEVKPVAAFYWNQRKWRPRCRKCVTESLRIVYRPHPKPNPRKRPLRFRTGIEPRFWATVDRSGGPEACWPWLAYRGKKGYGYTRSTTAHRLAWLFTGRRIPHGLELDHLCRNPSCVNPSHLEPVTHAENLRRARMG